MSTKPDVRLFARRPDRALMLFSGWTKSDGSIDLRPESSYEGRPGVAAILLTDGTKIEMNDGWRLHVVERKSRWP